MVVSRSPKRIVVCKPRALESPQQSRCASSDGHCAAKARSSWRFLICAVVGVAFASCSAASTTRPGGSSYSVGLGRLINDVNNQNHGDPYFRLAPTGTRVSMPEATAVHTVVDDCNEGKGTRVLVAGLVIGPTRSGSPVYWSVFVDPPGKHLGISGGTPANPGALNWFGGFVSVNSTQQPFCDFGHAANLPTLPVFGVHAVSTG